MKKFLSFFIIIILTASLFSATAIKSGGSRVIRDSVTFASLEDFLNAYLIAKEGGDFSHLIESGWYPENINLAGIDETLYLTPLIPEGFIIRSIVVYEDEITFWYLPKGVEPSMRAYTNETHFQLSVLQSRYENPMENILRGHGKTVDDLIDGKYLFNATNRFVGFTWEENGLLFNFDINVHQQHTEDFKELLGDVPVRELVRFAETRTVDLTDEEMVRNLIRYGERFLRGDVDGDGKVTTADALNILRYVAGLIELTAEQRGLYDVNKDSEINTADALAILRMVAGIE
jgi:hypothetical protein